MREHFADRLTAAIRSKRTAAVVGLDPLFERLPTELRPQQATTAAAAGALEAFGREVIDLVAAYVPAIKINSAFFEACYEAGVAAYYRLIEHAHLRGLLVIGDVKRGDIGPTAQLYARGHLAQPEFSDVDAARVADAVTVSGYPGEGGVRAFIEAARQTGRGLFVLVRPSDPGADRVHEFGGPRKFYEHMAALVHEWGAGPELIGRCGLSCVGAVVAPKDAAGTRALRDAMPHTVFLVPGYGAQGASAAACRPCFKPDGTAAIVSASRSVIYAFEEQRYRERFGDDWRACVAAACHEFASDIGRLTALGGTV